MTTQISQTYSFLPPNLGSCYVWLDASVSSNFTFVTGSNIASWIDRSGNGYSATAINNPTYDSGTMRVRFTSASSQFMSNVSAPLNLRQRSFFFVIEQITSQVVTGIMPIIPNPTSGTDYQTTTGMTIEENNGVLFYANSGGYLTRVSNSVPLPKGIYSEVFSNPNGTGYLNGSVNGSSVATFTPGTSSGYGLGGRWANGVQGPYLNGYYYEVLVYSKALSTTERQQIEGYLAWKWGLQGSLPASHPYKGFPPFANLYTLPVSITAPQSIQLNTLFAPTQIPGCQLWLDASDPTTVSLSGTTVTQWRDKSGQGNTATPTGTISYTSKINNLTAMSYPGTFNTYFKGSLTNTGTTLTAFSVFVTNTSSYSVVRILSLAKDGANDFNNNLYVAAIQRQNANFVSYRNLVTLGLVAATLDTPSLFTTQFTGSSNTVYWNGSPGTTAASSGNFGYTNYEVGTSYGEESAVNLNGSVGEVVVYHASLTTAQRQQVEGYLAWKWGLQGTLPASHPYKNSPFPGISYAPNPAYPPRIQSFSWQPSQLSGLAFWIDAADSSTIGVSGSTVTSVSDKSGTNKAITVGGTVTYVPKQALVFTDTNGILNVASMPAAPYDILTVATANSVTNIYRTLFRTASSPGTHPILLQINTNNLGMWSVNTFSQFGSLTMTANEKALVYASMAIDRTIQASKNGTASLTNPSIAGNESQITVVGNSVGGGQPWGTVQEIVLYSRTLTTIQRQQVEGYLAWKWALQTSLPANHPYRLFPPAP